MVGAPRFELGTSSAPDSYGAWCRVVARGGKWDGYRVSAHPSPHGSVARPGQVCVPTVHSGRAGLVARGAAGCIRRLELRGNTDARPVASLTREAHRSGTPRV